MKGHVARGFERRARRCQAGDDEHRGLIFAALTLTRRGLSECLPPSLAAAANEKLRSVFDWARNSGPYKSVQAARAESFESLGHYQQKTLDTLRAALPPQTGPSGPLDEHAERVVERYVALSVRHAMSSLLLCCDGVVEPLQLLEVPGEVAGAIAYRNVGLGPARAVDLRERARENAAWEHKELPASRQHGEIGLTLQLFHEYLGVHWKNNVDAQRLYLEQFLAWASP